MSRDTIVYVDGFNLYYGCLRGTPYKWLDLEKLCGLLLPSHVNRIVAIKYFTARVQARAGDVNKPIRQQAYFRALSTSPKISIIEGQFLTHVVRMRTANSSPPCGPYIDVVKTEEKGSDVNLASHLLMDGFDDEYEVAVVVSNDSDLLEPIRMVRRKLGKVVGLLNPHPKPSAVLVQEANFVKQIRKGPLGAAQFRATLSDSKGAISKPNGW